MNFKEISQVSFQGEPALVSGLEWIMSAILPYLTGRILELGSGEGTVSSALIDHGISLHLSDPTKENRNSLRQRFNGSTLVKSIHRMDFNRNDFSSIYSQTANKFDTVLALNIYEQGFFHKAARQQAGFLLRESGLLIVLAPVYTAPYYQIDENSIDIKKFNLKTLQHFCSDELELLTARYFNFLELAKSASENRLGLSALVIAQKKQMQVNG